MRKTRSYEFLICVDSSGTSSAWLVENRRVPGDLDRNRASRMRLDLDCGDLSGLTNRQAAWLIAHAITDAQERDPEYRFYS